MNLIKYIELVKIDMGLFTMLVKWGVARNTRLFEEHQMDFNHESTLHELKNNWFCNMSSFVGINKELKVLFKKMLLMSRKNTLPKMGMAEQGQ